MSNIKLKMRRCPNGGWCYRCGESCRNVYRSLLEREWDEQIDRKLDDLLSRAGVRLDAEH